MIARPADRDKPIYLAMAHVVTVMTKLHQVRTRFIKIQVLFLVYKMSLLQVFTLAPINFSVDVV
jgi:hypothetical protein